MHICLLDIDGTLLLTGGAGQAAFAQTLAAEFGIAEITTRVLFAGRSDRAIATELLEKHGIEPSAENWERFCSSYLARLDDALVSNKGHILPGVHELLNRLEARGDVALGLLTGNVREGAEKAHSLRPLAPLPIRRLRRRPSRTLRYRGRRAQRRATSHRWPHNGAPSNGSSHGQIVVIGDTPNDITCGRSIGARCVAVPTGFTTADDLRRSAPDVLVDTLEDIGPIPALFDEA